MSKFSLYVEKKNGLVYKTPLLVSKEEEAASMVKAFYDAIASGQKHYFLSAGGEKRHTMFVLDEISCVYYSPIDNEIKSREKEEKELRLRMLRAQVDYYESLAAGEAWKKNPYE